MNLNMHIVVAVVVVVVVCMDVDRAAVGHSIRIVQRAEVQYSIIVYTI